MQHHTSNQPILSLFPDHGQLSQLPWVAEMLVNFHGLLSSESYTSSRIPPSFHLPMSSSTTSSNFQLIFDAALSDYTKQTNIDLAIHPSAQTLQNCPSADAVFDLLQDRAKQFQAYRDGNRKLINCLKPVVQVLHTVSGVLNEAAAFVSTAALLLVPILIPLQVPFQPTKAILVGVDVLLAVRISLVSPFKPF